MFAFQHRHIAARPSLLSMLVVTVLYFSLDTPAYSQLSSGTILGTVSDASGAVIPGVSVRVTNPGIGLVRETITNESGNYRVEQLPVGAYTVEAELSGFKKGVRS